MERPVSLPTLAQVDQTSVCVEWEAVPLKYDNDEGRHVWVDVCLSFQLQMQQVKEDDAVLDEAWCTQYHGPATHVQVKGLHPGRKYAMRVQQYTEGLTDPSVSVELAPPSDMLLFETKATCPSAMLPPILQARDHHSLTLKWSDPEENGGHPVSEYVLEGTLPPKVQEAAQVQMNSQGMFEIYRGSGRMFTWGGLSPGHRYNVRVKAVNCLGDGAFSSIASFLTQPTVPDAPPRVSCTSTSADMLTIEWPQPLLHGSESTFYSIEIDDGSGKYRHVAKVQVCTLVLAKLKSDTEYKIRVCAENSEGCSPWSPVASHRTIPALEKPSTPRKLSHHRSGNASVFSWEPCSPTHGEKYVLEVAEMDNQRSMDEKRQLWKVRYKSDEPEYTILTLKGDLKYQCAVKSVNDAGNSSYCRPIIVDMKEISQNVKPPSMPQDLKYDDDTDTFSWKSKTRAKEDVYIFELQVVLAADLEDKKKNPWKLVYRGEESSNIGWDVESGAKYLARVRSIYGGKFSEWTRPMELWYESRSCPGEITNLQAQLLGTGGIQVEWDPLAEDGVSTRRFEYSLESKSEDDEEFRTVYRGCDTVWTIQDVVADVSYCFRVCGVNKYGYGPRSQPVYIITKSMAPSAPSDVKFILKDKNSVHLSWKLQNQVKIPVTDIQIEEIKMDRFFKTAPVIHATGFCESYKFKELKAGTVYMFRVRAKNAHGFGQWSSSLSVETNPDVPDRTSTPKVTPTGSGNIFKANWSYPEDNGGVITDFEVGLSTSRSFDKSKVIYHGPDVSCRVHDLDFSTEYFLRVRANNCSGNGPWSNIKAIVTPEPPPMPPKNIAVHVDGGVLISWKRPVESAGCTGYEVEVIKYASPTSHEGKHRTDRKSSVVFRKFLNATQTTCRCSLPDSSPGSEMCVRVRSIGKHGIGCGHWSRQYTISMDQQLHQSSSDVSSSSSDRTLLESSDKGSSDIMAGYTIKHRNNHFGEFKVARKPKKQKSQMSRIRLYVDALCATHGTYPLLAGCVFLFFLGMWFGITRVS